MTFNVASPNLDVLSLIIDFLLAKIHRENILKRTIVLLQNLIHIGQQYKLEQYVLQRVILVFTVQYLELCKNIFHHYIYVSNLFDNVIIIRHISIRPSDVPKNQNMFNFLQH